MGRGMPQQNMGGPPGYNQAMAGRYPQAPQGGYANPAHAQQAPKAPQSNYKPPTAPSVNYGPPEAKKPEPPKHVGFRIGDRVESVILNGPYAGDFVPAKVIATYPNGQFYDL